jgi:hypothetical protein
VIARVLGSRPAGRLDDLENRARAGCLDFGGPVAPESLRMLCCDAAVVPVVLNGKGQPLDVGRAILAAAARCPGRIVTTFSRGSWAVRRNCRISLRPRRRALPHLAAS